MRVPRHRRERQKLRYTTLTEGTAMTNEKTITRSYLLAHSSAAIAVVIRILGAIYIDTMENSSSYVAATSGMSLVRRCTILSLLLISSQHSVDAFTSPIFQETAALQRTAPSKTEGVAIELPDFDEFFGRIQAISPLAKLAIEGGGSGEGGGFAAVDDTGEYQLVL